MTPEEQKRISLEKALKEVYTCANPETCPHPLHRMSVEEYQRKLVKQAQGAKP